MPEPNFQAPVALYEFTDSYHCCDLIVKTMSKKYFFQREFCVQDKSCIFYVTRLTTETD